MSNPWASTSRQLRFGTLSPELLTRMSQRPSSPSIRAQTASTSSALLMSAGATRAVPPAARTAAAEIEKAGGRALPLVVDVRDDQSVKEALDKTAQAFGGIDI